MSIPHVSIMQTWTRTEKGATGMKSNYEKKEIQSMQIWINEFR